MKSFVCAAVGGFAFTAPLMRLAPVAAHDNECDSVDETGYPEIAYEDATAYDPARLYAVGMWDSHVSVDIHADDFWSAADLEFKDYFGGTTTPWAVYHHKCFPGFGVTIDEIKFNHYLMYSPPYHPHEDHRNHTASHEVGHALDFEDLDSSSWPNELMRGSHPSTAIAWVTAHAHYDYHGRWGCPSGHSCK